MLPAFPAFALLTARFLGTMLGWDEGPTMSKRWITVGQAFFAGLLIVLGAVAPFAYGMVSVILSSTDAGSSTPSGLP